MANLSALLEKEASAEIENIHSEAERRASEIVSNAEAEAEGIVAQRERTAKSQREAALVRAQSAAQLEASSLKLRARHDLVEKVFQEAHERIEALIKNEKDYQPVLKQLLEEALEAAGGKSSDVSAVIVHPDDKALAEKVAADLKLKTKVETSEAVRSGVKVRTGQSSVLENTLLERLDALRDDLASEVSAVLFSGAKV